MKISRQFRQHIAGWICPELVFELSRVETQAKNMQWQRDDQRATIKALKAEVTVFTEQTNELTGKVTTLRAELIQSKAVVSQMRGLINRYDRPDLPTEIKPLQLPEINTKSVGHSNVVPLTQTIGQT